MTYTADRKKSNPWIAYRKPNPRARIRLFCFPYAGSSAVIFHDWANHLPQEIDVCPVQLPGRGTRHHELPFTHLAPLILALGRFLKPYLDMPYVFFGHSMGALLSFELLRELRRQRMREPLHLFVSGRGAPQIPDPNPHLSKLPNHEFIKELRRYKGTPEVVLRNKEMMAIFFPLLRADFAVCETYVYRPQPPLDCPVTAFGGYKDETVSTGNLMSWQAQTETVFKHFLFPGDHFFIHENQQSLLQTLSQELEPIIEELVS